MEQTRTGLFLDDVRWPSEVAECVDPNLQWYRAKDAESFMLRIERSRERARSFWFDRVAFDFYLGPTAKNGMDCLRFLLAFCESEHLPIPVCTFHSNDKAKRIQMIAVYKASLPADHVDYAEKVVP